MMMMMMMMIMMMMMTDEGATRNGQRAGDDGLALRGNEPHTKRSVMGTPNALVARTKALAAADNVIVAGSGFPPDSPFGRRMPPYPNQTLGLRKD